MSVILTATKANNVKNETVPDTVPDICELCFGSCYQEAQVNFHEKDPSEHRKKRGSGFGGDLSYGCLSRRVVLSHRDSSRPGLAFLTPRKGSCIIEETAINLKTQALVPTGSNRWRRRPILISRRPEAHLPKAQTYMVVLTRGAA